MKEGLIHACQKRPISMKDIDNIVEKVEKQVYAAGEDEISSRRIGEAVMGELKQDVYKRQFFGRSPRLRPFRGTAVHGSPEYSEIRLIPQAKIRRAACFSPERARKPHQAREPRGPLPSGGKKKPTRIPTTSPRPMGAVWGAGVLPLLHAGEGDVQGGGHLFQDVQRPLDLLGPVPVSYTHLDVYKRQA